MNPATLHPALHLHRRTGDVVVLASGGSDKSTQAKDIEEAKDLAKTLEN